MDAVAGGGKVACHYPGEQPGVSTNEMPVAVGRRLGSSSVVEMKSIVKTFGRGGARRTKTVALGGVDLHIGHGESVGIVGESGSGKTTLARVLIGLESAVSGTTSIARHDQLRPSNGSPRISPSSSSKTPVTVLIR